MPAIAVKLEFKRELGAQPPLFYEIGAPQRFFRSPTRNIVAIASAFSPLSMPGRTTVAGDEYLYRLSFYGADDCKKIAAFDNASYSINDVDFHPEYPVAAIAAGHFEDNCSEGELILWNWESDEWWSILSNTPQVVRVQFVSDGTQLKVAARVPEETEASSPGKSRAKYITWEISNLNPDEPLRVPENLAPLDLTATGFPAVESKDARTDIFDWCSQTGKDRSRIWDLTWLPNGTIMASHSRCFFELWEPSGELTTIGTEGSGFQILNDRDRGRAHINIAKSTDVKSRLSSELWTVETPYCGLVRKKEFSEIHTFSLSEDGWLLGRQDRTFVADPGEDVLISPEGETHAVSLGAYDPGHHYLRLDGGFKLYFIQGTPPESLVNKVICSISPADKNPTVLWPAEWDAQRNSQLMSFCGCLVDDELGKDMVFGAQIYSTYPTFIICRRNLKDGALRWALPISAEITALQYSPAHQVIMYAQIDGRFVIASAATGQAILDEYVRGQGINGICLSIAVDGENIALGLADGRILHYTFVPSS